MMKKKYSLAVETLKKTKYGNGRDIVHHLLNGSEAYRSVFYELVRLVDQNEETGFWIFKSALLDRAKVHPSMASYVLYKFEKEGYIRTKLNKIYVDQNQIEDWELLCGIIQSVKEKQ